MTGLEIGVGDIATGLIAAGLLALISRVITLGTRVTVLESHYMTTEEMRGIMQDVQRPLLEEVRKLEDQIAAMQSQIGARRYND